MQDGWAAPAHPSPRDDGQIVRKFCCIAAAGLTFVIMLCVLPPKTQAEQPTAVSVIGVDDDYTAVDFVFLSPIQDPTVEPLDATDAIVIDFDFTREEISDPFGYILTSLSATCSQPLFGVLKPRMDLCCVTPASDRGLSTLQYRFGVEIGTGKVTASADFLGDEEMDGSRLHECWRGAQIALNWQVTRQLLVSADIQFSSGTTAGGPFATLQAVHTF